MRRAPSRVSSSRLIVSSLRAASSVITLNMSRRSFLAGGGAPASFQHGQGGRYAAFSCQGLIHRFRRYLSWLAQPLEWRRAILHLVTERIEVAPDPGHGGGKKGAMGGTFNPDRVIVKFAA